MTVYVDNYRTPYGRMKMSHMMADTLEELHAMADKIGLKREWFQSKSRPHYDVCESRREQAIMNGAIPMTAINMCKLLRHRQKHGADSCPACLDDAEIYVEARKILCSNCGWDSVHWNKNYFEETDQR